MIANAILLCAFVASTAMATAPTTISPVPAPMENSLKTQSIPGPEMLKKLGAFSDALKTARASDPATASLAASLAVSLAAASPEQQSSNLNLGQMGDFLMRVVQTIVERMLTREAQQGPSAQSSGTGIFNIGAGSVGPGFGFPMATPSVPSTGFGNMFNPMGSLSSGGFNPFSMMLPSLMFDAFDFI